MSEVLKIIMIFLGVAGVCIILTFAMAYYMYRFSIVRDMKGKRQRNLWEEELPESKSLSDADNKKMQEGARWIKSNLTELVKIKSFDGLTLVGHIIEHPNPLGVCIMAHGYRSHAIYDFSCAAEDLFKRGFSLLLIDQRAHGYSEGRHIGFGVTERYDIVRWAAFAEERWDLPIIMDGVSMGAATVLMGCAVGYPKRVSAIIADCGYTNAGEICKIVMKKWFKLPPFPVYHAARLLVKLFAKYDLEAADTRVAITQSDVPILLAHGHGDDFVPYYMSEENYAAGLKRKQYGKEAKIELFTSSAAKHAQSYLCDKDGYNEAIDRLLYIAGIVRFENRQMF